MRRLVLCAFFSVACGGSNGAGPQSFSDVYGAFALQMINGQRVPVKVGANSTDTLYADSGSITFRNDGTYSYAIWDTDASAQGKFHRKNESVGAFTLTGSGLALSPTGSGRTVYTGQVSSFRTVDLAPGYIANVTAMTFGR